MDVHDFDDNASMMSSSTMATSTATGQVWNLSDFCDRLKNDVNFKGLKREELNYFELKFLYRELGNHFMIGVWITIGVITKVKLILRWVLIKP